MRIFVFNLTRFLYLVFWNGYGLLFTLRRTGLVGVGAGEPN